MQPVVNHSNTLALRDEDGSTSKLRIVSHKY